MEECRLGPTLPWKCGSYDLEAVWRSTPTYQQKKLAEETSKKLEKTGVGAKAALGVIKTVVGVYDTLTFPIYFLGQRPWRHWGTPNYARRLDPNNPHSPIVSIRPKQPSVLDGLETVDQLFRECSKRYGTKPCYGYRQILGETQESQPDGGIFKKLLLADEYTWMSYEDADRRVETLSRALLSIGVRPRVYICILAETRMEWMLMAQACFRINVPVATLYATLGEDGIVHGLNETSVQFLVTTHDLLPKLKKVTQKTPDIRHIIYMEGFNAPDTSGFPDHVTLHPFSKFEALGDTYDMSVQGEAPAAKDEAIIMYTSGSTGIPKGVILLHSNIIITSTALSEALPPLEKDEMYIGYLPLAHIMELSAECICSLNGIPIGYSSPITLTDTSTAIPHGAKGDTTLLKPTFMVAVPLVLDRIRKGIVEKVSSRGKFAKSFFNFAVKYKIKWYKRGFGTPLLDKIVFGKVREVVGGRLHFMASGGAPLSADTHDFIRACLGVRLQQGYGLTETGSCATIMQPGDRYSGKVGAPLSVCQIRLDDWPEGGYSALDVPNPRGEIVIGGPCVSAGYFKNESATLEAYSTDEEGVTWFATGDIGELFSDGTVKIIDRKKDLVKLQFGEYVSLGKVESELKSCPVVDNLCVYGSSFHAYTIALVSPNRNYLNNLAKELGKGSLTFEQQCEDKIITSTATKMVVDHAKKCGLHKTETPTKIKLCSEEWIPDSGLVTAALKIRRKPIEQFYQAAIQAMYAEDNKS